MSAINLMIDEKKISYDIINNVIILKKNNRIVFKLPIPNGYYLIATRSQRSAAWDEKIFIITPYKLLPPTFIPYGYGNLEISVSGMWTVEEDSKVQNSCERRKLYYLDTSLLNISDFIKAFDNNIKISNEDIPKSFWFSDQYRDLLEVFNIPNSMDRIKPKYIPEYIEKFDARARLISEYECMSIIAFNDKLVWNEINVDLYPDAFYQDNGEFMLVANNVCIENFDKVVASNENPKVYRSIIEKEHNRRTYLRNCAFTAPDDKLSVNSAHFVIPVIDEESEKCKVLQYTNRNKFD